MGDWQYRGFSESLIFPPLDIDLSSLGESLIAIPAPFAGKLTLDEAGFIVLANAIHLSYLNGILIDDRERAELREQYKGLDAPSRTQQEYKATAAAMSERTSYRDFLQHHEISDARIEGPYRVDNNYPPEPFLDKWNRWAELIEGDAEMATIRFMNLNLSTEQIQTYGLYPSPHERRNPIAQQYPNDTIRSLRSMVVDYFVGMDSAGKIQESSMVNPQSVISGECGKVTKNDRDKKYVLEGVEMVQNEQAGSAHDAATQLVLKYGVVVKGTKKSKGKIIASSHESAITRLQKKISTALKSK